MITRVDGVSFVNANVAAMTKEEFIAAHIKVLWLNSKTNIRKKRLSEVYDLVTKATANKA